MIKYCPECKFMAEYKDEENYSEGIVCDKCKDILFEKWKKEDNLPGGGIIFHSKP